jgi:predicted DNA-binding protein
MPRKKIKRETKTAYLKIMVEPSVKERYEQFIHGQGREVSEFVRDLIDREIEDSEQ